MSAPDGFRFRLDATDGAARTGVFLTPRGAVRTPVFMPVGTLGAVKTLSPDEVEATGATMILANTYHLHLRPGEQEVAALGGLHSFMRWKGPILTDSGGYQVFSLAAISDIREDGVLFRSHIDGSERFFTPESVMGIQRTLGADVVMAFDQCPPGGCSKELAREANERTLRWLVRSRDRFVDLSAGASSAQALFPVLQGNIYPDLRLEHARQVQEVDEWPGFGIGGLSVGEDKAQMWATLEVLDPELPRDRPRYLMGVGYPDDLLEAIGRGCDMFDCVAPTRNARHGTAWTAVDGQINLKAARFRGDTRPLEEDCDCYCCRSFDRAYLRHLTVAGESFGHRLLSMHNIRFLSRLVTEAASRIRRGEFEAWSSAWLERYRSARG